MRWNRDEGGSERGSKGWGAGIKGAGSVDKKTGENLPLEENSVLQCNSVRNRG